jgi:hypothetical protein
MGVHKTGSFLDLLGRSDQFERQMILRLLISIALCLPPRVAALAATNASPQPLVLETTIALPNAPGRIDHMDIDLARKRLFVVELGNGSVDVVDLLSRKVIHRITKLDEPQGIVYIPKADLVAIACGGDGTVRIFSGADFVSRGVVKLGDDADNVRLDPRSGNIVVGYGKGGLAVIDPVKAVKLKNIRLPGHPEGFQLSDGRAYANVPEARQIDVADLSSGKLVATWMPPHLSSNFPMVIGGAGAVAVVFRAPARLALFDPTDGHIATAADTCGDADDVFFDARRLRYIVSCGAGAIDVFQTAGSGLKHVARISTSRGARTSLFVPELDRLFLAVRARSIGADAAIQIFRPMP